MSNIRKTLKESQIPSGFEIAQMVGCGDIYKKSAMKRNQMKENKNIINLSESDLYQIIKESVKNVLKEEQCHDQECFYDGDGDNYEQWDEAGFNPYDFSLMPDDEVAQFHSSKKGFVIKFKNQEFGEAWMESDGTIVGNSDNEIFDGYTVVFRGYGIDGFLEDVMDRTSDAILYGEEDDIE